MKRRMMTAKEEERFLAKQREALERILSVPLNKAAIKIGGREPDIVDEQVQQVVLYTEARVLDNESGKRRKARIAIHKMDAGTYFHCSQCDGEIAIQRLIAIKEALLCIQCEENEERSKRFDTVLVPLLA
jgi:RNA polymerase-binding transcription factor DksA